jgi:hypothetical protein
MENVFDSLCSALGEPENKKLFLDSEGVDLMVLMLKYAFMATTVPLYTNQITGRKSSRGRGLSKF